MGRTKRQMEIIHWAFFFPPIQCPGNHYRTTLNLCRLTTKLTLILVSLIMSISVHFNMFYKTLWWHVKRPVSRHLRGYLLVTHLGTLTVYSVVEELLLPCKTKTVLSVQLLSTYSFFFFSKSEVQNKSDHTLFVTHSFDLLSSSTQH